MVLFIEEACGLLMGSLGGGLPDLVPAGTAVATPGVDGGGKLQLDQRKSVLKS